jgi:CO/xanthine dehydrogenase Mo-binding subunit
VAPAIANAIDDAVGVRLLTTTLTIEAIHRGLRAGIGAPLSATAT